VPAAQSAENPASSGSAAQELGVLSNEAYVEKFGAQMALTQGVPLPSQDQQAQGTAERPAPALAGQWDILYTSIDWEGQDIPTRRGNGSFGQSHACEDHNMCSKKAITAPYNGLPDRQNSSGNRGEYDGVVTTNSGQVRLTITSVAEWTEGTVYWGRTPDGRPVGTITSFCRGQTYCPDWINDI
jgi:hypothetical protein